MTERIFDELLTETRKAEYKLATVFHHHVRPSATISTSTTEEAPVSVLDEIKTGLDDIATKFETLDAEAISKVDAIKANPEAAAVLDVLATVAKAELPSGMITAVTSGLGLLTRFAAAQTASADPADPVTPAGVPQPVPAGPVVGGAAT